MSLFRLFDSKLLPSSFKNLSGLWLTAEYWIVNTVFNMSVSHTPDKQAISLCTICNRLYFGFYQNSSYALNLDWNRHIPLIA